MRGRAELPKHELGRLEVLTCAFDVHGVVESGQVAAEADVNRSGSCDSAGMGVDPERSFQTVDPRLMVQTRDAEQVTQSLEHLGRSLRTGPVLLHEPDGRAPVGGGLGIREDGVRSFAGAYRVVDRLRWVACGSG